MNNKIEISKKELKKIISIVMLATAKNPTADILSHLRFNLDGNKLIISSTNCEHEIYRKIILSKEYEAQDFLIKAEKLKELLAKIKSENLLISCDYSDSEEDKIFIEAGKAKLELKSPKAANFPKIIESDTKTKKLFTIAQKDLYKAIDNVDFSIFSKNKERYNLTGLYFSTEEGINATIVSTDGSRLSECILESARKIELSTDFLIERKIIKALKAMLKKNGATLKTNNALPASINLTKDVTFLITTDKETKIQIKNGNTILNCKTVDATFPDYKKVTPENNDKIVEFDRKELIEAIDFVKISGYKKDSPVNLAIKKDKINLSMKNNKDEKTSYEIPCKFNQESEFHITFNALFITEPLERMELETVKISFLQYHKPALLKNGSCTYVIMPAMDED